MATTLDIAVNALVNKQNELLNLLSTSAATVKRYGPINSGTISIKPNNDETTTGQTWIFSSLIAKSNLWLYKNLFQYGLTEYRGDGQPTQWPAAIFWKCVSDLLIPTQNTPTSVGFRINPNVFGVPAGTSQSTDKINSWITIDASPIFKTNDFIHTYHYLSRFMSGDPGHSDIGDFKFLRNTGFIYTAPFIYNHKTSLTYNVNGGLTGFCCQDLTRVNASDTYEFSSRLECYWMFGFQSNININLDVCFRLNNGVKVNGAWNFYAAGNAPNFFAGKVLIGSNIPSGIAKLECSGYGYFENKLIVGANTGTTLGASLSLSFANREDDAAAKLDNAWHITSFSDDTLNRIKILRIWTAYQTPGDTRVAPVLDLRSTGDAILHSSSLLLGGIVKPKEAYGDFALAIANNIKLRGTKSVESSETWTNSFISFQHSPYISRDADVVGNLSRTHHIIGISNTLNMMSGLISNPIPGDSYKTGLDIRWVTGFKNAFVFRNDESSSLLKFNIRNDLRAFWIQPLTYYRSTNIPALEVGDDSTKETIAIGGSIHGVVVDNMIPRNYINSFKLEVTSKIYGISTWQENQAGFKVFNFFAGGNAPSYFNGNVKIGNGDLNHDDADNFSANLLKGLDSEDSISKNYNFEVADFTHLEHVHVYYPQKSNEVIQTYTVSGTSIIFTTTNPHTFRYGETVSVIGVDPPLANGIYAVQSIGKSGTGLLANEYNTFRVNYVGSAPGAFVNGESSVVSNVSSLVELGHPSVANVPTIDFHCIARTVISNYDVRFQVSQISTVGFNSDIAGGLNGEGRLTILGKEFFFTNSLSKVALRVGNDGTAQIGYQDLSVPGILNISGTATDAVSTASGKLCINGKQVLTHQRPFWDHASWPVEATSQITPLSTFGATYVQADLNTLLLQFKQLVAALKKHGILGTAANGTDVTQLTGLRT